MNCQTDRNDFVLLSSIQKRKIKIVGNIEIYTYLCFK